MIADRFVDGFWILIARLFTAVGFRSTGERIRLWNERLGPMSARGKPPEWRKP